VDKVFLSVISREKIKKNQKKKKKRGGGRRRAVSGRIGGIYAI
jgi:hypothetical protein